MMELLTTLYVVFWAATWVNHIVCGSNSDDLDNGDVFIFWFLSAFWPFYLVVAFWDWLMYGEKL